MTKNGLHKNIKITGFYLQKILNNSSVDCDDVEEDLRKKLKLDGFTIDDEDLINKFDSSYENSEVIKGMSVTSKGFSRYAKLVSSENIEKISSLVDEKTIEFNKEIKEGISTGEYKLVFKTYSENTLVQSIRKTFVVTE